MSLLAIKIPPDNHRSVSLDTVRGQLLYEIQGRYYYNPDVIADLSGIRLEALAVDRVRVSGVNGEF